MLVHFALESRENIQAMFTVYFFKRICTASNSTHYCTSPVYLNHCTDLFNSSRVVMICPVTTLILYGTIAYIQGEIA